MVGVPGRSKACHTCKRRKRGCDQQHPACGQCQLAGLQCEGFDKPRIFVNSTQGHGGASADRFTPQSYSALPLVNSTAHIARQADAALALVPISSVPQKSLERSALEMKYFDSYWTSVLPNGKAFSSQALQSTTCGWTNIVQDLCYKDDLVRGALLAGAAGLIGQQSGQKAMAMEGSRMYGRSLQIMAKSLPTVNQDRISGLHVTSKLLAQYELLQAASSDETSLPGLTWLRHTTGEMALITARKPEDFADGSAHQLFASARQHVAYPSLITCTRCVLSLPEWKTIPWSLHPKTPKDELVDILIDLPAVLEDFNDPSLLTDTAENRTLRLQRLEDRCWLHDSQLQTWCRTSGSTAMAFIEPLLTIEIEDEETRSPSNNEFALAHLGLIYLAICCLLYWHLWQLTKNKQPDVLQRINPRRYCREIALLVPYFQAPSMGACFLNIVAFPAGAALRILIDDPSEDSSEDLDLLQKSFTGRHGAKLRKFFEGSPWRSDRQKEWVRRVAETADQNRAELVPEP